MAPRSVTNAFGDGSPSWNIPFPVGNLTAAEIIAYLPHWLKSVDVISRFVGNGGGSTVIVDMINEFRELPLPDPSPTLMHRNLKPTPMHRNSICIMMQNAMRNAGNKHWTVGTHFDFIKNTLSEWDTGDVSVTTFRLPRETHPKSGNAVIFNKEARPIEFRDLAKHIKRHPSGADALDLTRCVAWARSHPEQSWLFPTQFQELVEKLGGARDVTVDNSDTEVFTRYSPNVTIVPLNIRSQRLRKRPASHTAARSVNKKSGGRDNHSQIAQRQSLTRSQPPLVSPEINHSEDLTERIHLVTSTPDIRLTRSQQTVAGNPAPLPQRRHLHPPSGAFLNMSAIRKSTRLAKMASQALYKSSEFSEGTQVDSATTETRDYDYTINNKRKREEEEAYEPAAQDPMSNSSDNGSIVENESSRTTPPRPAAKKARLDIQNFLTQDDPPLYHKTVQLTIPIDPALTAAARGFDNSMPIYVKPPVLNPNRPVVDRHSIWLYAEEGAPDLWASALSSTRFGGPRRSAPFRELHRLTQPAFTDSSDWAENIRWAKEQFKLFGSATWTEYDYHLEMITDHRRALHWVSEEMIQFG